MYSWLRLVRMDPTLYPIMLSTVKNNYTLVEEHWLKHVSRYLSNHTYYRPRLWGNGGTDVKWNDPTRHTHNFKLHTYRTDATLNEFLRLPKIVWLWDTETWRAPFTILLEYLNLTAQRVLLSLIVNFIVITLWKLFS